LAALLLVGGFSFLSGIAMRTLPAAHGGVVVGLLPLATALAASLLAGERPSLGSLLCIANHSLSMFV
jgi:drug/metabolite transporter (DMT)-like permease